MIYNTHQQRFYLRKKFLSTSDNLGILSMVNCCLGLVLTSDKHKHKQHKHKSPHRHSETIIIKCKCTKVDQIVLNFVHGRAFLL